MSEGLREDVGAGEGRRARLASLCACALLLVTFAVIWQVNLGALYLLDYDEGVYLCSARMMAQGHDLYTAVFSSQPPAYLPLLALAFRLGGDTVASGREVSVVAALVSLCAVAWIAWRLAGPSAAPLALFGLGCASAFFREARVAQAEMPALALALAALAALFAAERRRTRGWIAVGGACFATGALVKFLVAPLVCPALLLLVAGPSALVAARPRRLVRVDGATARRLLIFAAAGAAACVLLLLPWNPAAVYDQSVRFHEAMRRAFPLELSRNVREIEGALLYCVGLTITAAGGVLILLRKRPLAAAWLLLWAAANALFIAYHTPLYYHHLTLLLPPLAVAASANVLWLAPLHRAARTLCLVGLGLLLTVGSYPEAALSQGRLEFFWMPRHDAENLNEVADDEAREREVVSLIRQQTRPGELVVSDQQMQVFRADRPTPPQLCDTSMARARTGYLTGDDAIRASADARMIVLWTDQLTLLPGYRDWVMAHYRLLEAFPAPQEGRVREVYLKD